MGKPKPKRVPADECPVEIDGATYYPHEGEWVELYPIVTAEDLDLANDLLGIETEIKAVQGESDERQQVGRIMARVAGRLRPAIAPRLVAWNWTDLAGRALPQPDGTPGPLKRLSLDELFWLFRAGHGETAAERKKGSAGSPTTLSATGSAGTAASMSTTRASRSRSPSP